jgi:hypothetical protein
MLAGRVDGNLLDRFADIFDTQTQRQLRWYAMLRSMYLEEKWEALRAMLERVVDLSSA